MATAAERDGIFISYSRQDGEAAARALHARLQDQAPDLPAWIDRFEIEGGIGWWAQIERELDRAEFLVIVLTPAAAQSENTRREWRSARQRGVCVYPVFGLPAAQFDLQALPAWMRKRHVYDPELEWPKLLAHLRRGCQATRVPFMAPPLPERHVPRPRETEAALAGLLGSAPAVALRGAGGFGKTTLATALCHDDRAIDAFDDGILWVTLGPRPNVLAELVKLHAALTGQRPGFVDIEDAVGELALRLEHKTCLIVVDDVWSGADLRPFLRGGPLCRRLVTTRIFEVALEMQRIDVAPLSDSEALQLLAARIGPAAPPGALLQALAKRLGGWPLPTKLAGSAIRQRIERGDSAAGALAHVQRALDKRGIVAFDDPAGGRDAAVAQTVDASLDLLDEAERARCIELAVFGAEAVPLASAAALWQHDEDAAEDLARRLDNLGLVELDLHRGTLRLHDLLRELLGRRLAAPEAVHARLLQGWGERHALPHAHAWRGYARHLLRAAGAEALRALLLDARWLAAKLAATDVHALVADFECGADDTLLAPVLDALRLAAPVLALEPAQLGAQLWARLLAHAEPELAALRAGAARAGGAPWLRLLHATLDMPGGMLRTTLVGHTREVTAVALDASGEQVLTGSADASLRLWNAGSGQLLACSENLRLGVRGAALAAGVAVAAAADGRLYRWRVAAAEPEALAVGGRRRALTAVALSRDGSVALSASREPQIDVWDLTAGCRVGRLEGHEDEVTAVALSADGRRAVSASDDGTLRVWQLPSGRSEHTLRGHRGAVKAVALAADGRIALSGGTDRTLRLWDTARGEALGLLGRHEATVTAVALADGGARAISGAADREVLLWDLGSSQVIARLEGHAEAVNAVAIDDAGTRAATGSADGTVKLWQLARQRRAAPAGQHGGAVLRLAFSHDGRLLASGGADGAIVVRDVASGSVVREIPSAHAAPIRTLAFSADDSCVLSGAIDGQYWLFPVEAGEALWMPIRHYAPLADDALNDRFLVTAGADRAVYVWSVPSGTLVARWGTRRLFDHLIDSAPQRRSAGSDDALLDVYLGNERVFDVHAVRCGTRSGQFLLSAGVAHADTSRTAPVATTGWVLLLDIDLGGVRTIEVSAGGPPGVFALDAGGTRLLSARADHTIELRQAAAPARVALLEGHRDRISALAFAADGRHALSCARDRSVRVWDLDSGRALAGFTVDAALRCLAVSDADPRLLAVGDSAGRVHLLRWEDAAS